MEVNIKNKKYNYVEKSVVKLNDISASLINITEKEYMVLIFITLIIII